jgi:mono/diheme cytochrome c family protein
MKKTIVCCLALLSVGLMAVRGAEAKELWEKNCQKCHGPDGAGKTKMGEKLAIKDYTDPKVQSGLKEDEMVKAIKEGVKDGEKTRMKPYGETLSADEIKALVAYFRAFKK